MSVGMAHTSITAARTANGQSQVVPVDRSVSCGPTFAPGEPRGTARVSVGTRDPRPSSLQSMISPRAGSIVTPNRQAVPWGAVRANQAHQSGSAEVPLALLSPRAPSPLGARAASPAAASRDPSTLVAGAPTSLRASPGPLRATTKSSVNRQQSVPSKVASPPSSCRQTAPVLSASTQRQFSQPVPNSRLAEANCRDVRINRLQQQPFEALPGASTSTTVPGVSAATEPNPSESAFVGIAPTRLQPQDVFNCEMELRAPTNLVADVDAVQKPCSWQELEIAIQAVMQAIQAESAMRANEASDLRRELMQAMQRDREINAKEMAELKDEVTTQHGGFMKEIVRRSVFEATLKNEVCEQTKAPGDVNQRLECIDTELATLRDVIESTRMAIEQTVESSRAAIENFERANTLAIARSLSTGSPARLPTLGEDRETPELGPELDSHSMPVQVPLGASPEKAQQHLNALIAQRIEEVFGPGFGQPDDFSSLFGMAREALSNSKVNAEELRHVREVLGPKITFAEKLEEERRLLNQSQESVIHRVRALDQHVMQLHKVVKRLDGA